MSVRADTSPLSGPISGGKPGATVAVEPLLTGTMAAPMAFIESASSFPTLRMMGVGTKRSNFVDLPIPVYLIHHPTAGPFLIDTGLHSSIGSQPAENLGRILSRFSNPRVERDQELPAQLRARGIDPKSMRLIVMTHMHFDHTSGMSQFPQATYVITEDEWIAATTDRNPIMRGYRPAHYDYAFDYRTLSYDREGITSYATFGRTFDLFGDGSVRLASTPGHSAGHQSVICRLRDRDLVIAGDAIYTIGQLDNAPEPPRPVDRHNWRRSKGELQRFATTYPQAVILPGHDPEHWKTVQPRYE
jgi:glyoxylase-like metal-dependent hydrolase (beta-lactamase superfamily II)